MEMNPSGRGLEGTVRGQSALRLYSPCFFPQKTEIVRQSLQNISNVKENSVVEG